LSSVGLNNTTNYVYDGAHIAQEPWGATSIANLITGFGVDEVFSRNDVTEGPVHYSERSANSDEGPTSEAGHR